MLLIFIYPDSIWENSETFLPSIWTAKREGKWSDYVTNQVQIVSYNQKWTFEEQISIRYIILPYGLFKLELSLERLQSNTTHKMSDSWDEFIFILLLRHDCDDCHGHNYMYIHLLWLSSLSSDSVPAQKANFVFSTDDLSVQAKIPLKSKLCITIFPQSWKLSVFFLVLQLYMHFLKVWCWFFSGTPSQ